MERHFDTELNQLKEKLLKMAGMVEEAVSLSIKALVDRDEALAQQIIKEDQAINRMEIDIDEMAFKLLALHQPTAVDLRFIIMALRINTDLERMGDLSVNISERTLDLLKEPLLKPLIDIPRMATMAQKMVKDSLDAFVNKDPELARSVCKRDDEVDNLNVQIFRELLTYMIGDAQTIKRAIDLILVAKHLERIADHATNIGEDVVYLVKGKSIKHRVYEKTEQL